MSRTGIWRTRAGVLATAFLGGALSHWLLCGGGSGAAKAEEAVAEALRARAFVLVDAEGKERGRLGQAPEGLGLVLKDANARSRLALVVSAGDAAQLLASDVQGKPRLAVGVLGREAPGEGNETVGMHVRGADGKYLITQDASSEGTAVIFNSRRGEGGFEIGVRPDGSEAGIAIRALDGKPRITLGAGPRGSGLGLQDANAKERLALWSAPQAGAGVVVRDGQGRDIWLAPPPQANPAEQVVTLDMQAAGLTEAVTRTLNGTGLPFRLAPELLNDRALAGRAFAIKATNTPVGQVLDQLAAQYGIRWRLEGGAVVLERQR